MNKRPITCHRNCDLLSTLLAIERHLLAVGITAVVAARAAGTLDDPDPHHPGADSSALQATPRQRERAGQRSLLTAAGRLQQSILNSTQTVEHPNVVRGQLRGDLIFNRSELRRSRASLVTARCVVAGRTALDR